MTHSVDKSTGIIVSLAAVAWDFPLVGRTRMLHEAWHRAGRESIFVEAPHSWRAAIRRALRGPPPAPIPVIRPRPTWPARFWHQLGEPRVRRALRRRADSLRHRLGSRLDWSRATVIVVTPAWLPWLDALPFGRVIYDCIDDLAVHAPHPGLRRMIEAWERELIVRADAAVVTATSLGDRLRTQRPDLRIELIQNAADVERFQRLAASSPRPADLPTGRPILGFVGALFEWIDFDLIEQTARRARGWQLVLIGPTDSPARLRALQELPNVTWLGPRDPREVPAYVAAFDACWAPFRPIAVSMAANPVKLYEYLALGKPTLTTAVADMARFGETISVVHNVDDVMEALRRVDTESADSTEKRRRFAADNDWNARAGQYACFIEALSR